MLDCLKLKVIVQSLKLLMVSPSLCNVGSFLLVFQRTKPNMLALIPNKNP